MKLIARSALTGAIRILIGNSWWGRVREVVVELSRTDLANDEKRALAITTLKEGGWLLAGWLLNLAIEIAVAVMLRGADKIDPNEG